MSACLIAHPCTLNTLSRLPSKTSLTANRSQHLDFSTSVFPSLTKHNPSYPPFSTSQIALLYQPAAFLTSNYPAACLNQIPPRSVISQSSSAHDPRCDVTQLTLPRKKFCSGILQPRKKDWTYLVIFQLRTLFPPLSQHQDPPYKRASIHAQCWLMSPIEYRDQRAALCTGRGSNSLCVVSEYM